MDVMDVKERVEGDQLVLVAELPDVDPEKDVEVTVVDGRLRIHAEHRQEEKSEEAGFVRREVRFGSFDRSVPLPPGATEADVTATYADGVLEVRAPLAKAAELPAPAAVKVPITRS